MTLVMEKTEAHAADTTTPGSFELKVEIGKTAAFAFLLDPSGDGSGPEHFRRGRNRLPRYFDWLQVPSERALSLVDELMPRHPEVLPPLPFNLLVSPRWARSALSVEVFVNMAFRRHNELLVRVPAWAKFLIGHQPIERWIALQPYLARLGKVGLIGVDTSSTGGQRTEVTEALTHGATESDYRKAMSVAAERFAARAKKTYVGAVRVARLYAHAGRKAEALEWLDRAFDEREPALVHLAVAWDWHMLRAEPRFQDLLRKMNLELSSTSREVYDARDIP